MFFPPENGFWVQAIGLYVTTIKIERQETLRSTVKPAEQSPSKNLSLTFRNSTFSINKRQNTFFSHPSCDGSIAVQNELKFQTKSVPSINPGGSDPDRPDWSRAHKETPKLAGPRGSDISKLSSACPLPSMGGRIIAWLPWWRLNFNEVLDMTDPSVQDWWTDDRVSKMDVTLKLLNSVYKLFYLLRCSYF